MKLLLAFAQTGSITSAARACHVMQPTVSMQLEEHSDSVGLPLCEQIGRRVYLTAGGHAVAQTARSLLDERKALEQRVAATKGIHQRRLRVCIASTAKQSAFAAWAAHTRRRPGHRYTRWRTRQT